MHEDVSTMTMLMAAQNAGNGESFANGLCALGAFAACFVILIVVLVGILKFIFGGPADPPQDFYYPPSFYDGQDQPDYQRNKTDDSKETKS